LLIGGVAAALVIGTSNARLRAATADYLIDEHAADIKHGDHFGFNVSHILPEARKREVGPWMMDTDVNIVDDHNALVPGSPRVDSII
jgi:hypothetical protein